MESLSLAEESLLKVIKSLFRPKKKTKLQCN